MVNLKSLSRRICEVMTSNGRTVICGVYCFVGNHSGALVLDKEKCSFNCEVASLRGAMSNPAPEELWPNEKKKTYEPPFLYDMTSFADLAYVNEIGVKVRDTVTFLIGVLETSVPDAKNYGVFSFIVSATGRDLQDTYVICLKTNRFNSSLPSAVEGSILKEVVKEYLTKMHV